MDFDREKIVASFLVESDEGLDRTEQHLIAAETDPENSELLDEMFRVAHTIKGNAAALDFPELAGFAHVMEDLFEAVRAHKVALSHDVVAVLLHAVDALRALVPAAAEGNDRLSPSHQEVKRLMAAHASGLAVAAQPSPDSTFAEVPSPAQVPGAAVLGSRSRTLRVDIQKLDEMLNLAGEIAIAQGRLRRMIAEVPGEQGRRLLDIQREAEDLQRDLQESVMGVRMVPVGPLFQQFARSVRDISQSHNKLARLEISGAEVEVDTRVLENLKDPLLHMIRNAIDHGIEMPDVRHAKGKNPCGLLKLSAVHSAGNIVILLSDDGAGFNRERIQAKARALNLIGDEQLSDQELFNLVFTAGFSTADHVSDLSGRGVGMDVVRRNIDLLRGTIEIRSTEDQGTTLCIRLPLTLAIIDGFSVVAGGETYVIPLELIKECVELPADQISHERSGVVNLCSEPLPFVRLRKAFDCTYSSLPARENIVVLRHEDGSAGIAVDKLLGECQAIIKPLSRLFRDVRGVSGSTILDDGRVGLILDVSTLLREVIAEHTQLVS